MAAPNLYDVDPELLAKLGAAQAPASPSGPVTPNNVASFSDAVLAAPPPAPATVAPPSDPTQASGIPPAGVSFTPPPAAAPAPAMAPAVPAAPADEVPAPAPAPARKPSGPATPDAMALAQKESLAAGQEATAAGQEGVELAKQKADTDAQADQARAKAAQESVDRATALQATQKKAYDEAVNSFNQKQADVANFKFKDYWADKTAGQMVLSGIGMLLGGVSWDPHHENQAVKIVQDGIAQDAQQQLEYLHSKEHVAELAGQGVGDIAAYQAHEMENFHASEALKKEAVATQIDTLSSTVRGAQNVNAAKALAAQLRQSAAKDQENSIIQGTHNRVMQSEIVKNRAEAANAGVARKAALDTKAQVVANQVVEKRLNDDKTVTTLLKEREELQKADAASIPGPNGRVNGTAFQGAVDGFTKAISGLGARPGSVAMTTGAMGGLVDKIERNVQKGVDGEYTAHDVKTFREGLKKIEDANRAAVEQKRAEHRAAFARNPLTKPHTDIYESALDQRFGAAQPAPAGPPPGAVIGTMNGRRGYVLNGQFTAM